MFTAHPFVHYDKLVLADRPVVVSDVWFHQGSGIYPTADNPALRLPDTYSESDLRSIDWPAYRLADWDYVLIRTRPAASEPQRAARSRARRSPRRVVAIPERSAGVGSSRGPSMRPACAW